MLKPICYSAILLGGCLLSGFKLAADKASISPTTTGKPAQTNSVAVVTTVASRYSEWQLEQSGLSRAAFDCAMKGYELLKSRNSVKKELLTIIDFSKSSSQKRLFIINTATGKLLLSSLVAHGRNSGNEYATRFSNERESLESSLGFYITLGTYTGAHGYSLRLKGCEKGFNDAAYARDIVMHAADYVSDEVVSSRGIPGRSFGCPAVPEKLHKKIIGLVKNGSCLFIYHPDKKYLTQSQILNGNN